MVADGANNVYLMTGNGDFDANVAGGDYGDSFVKFSGPSLAVADYFTPWNQGTLPLVIRTWDLAVPCFCRALPCL